MPKAGRPGAIRGTKEEKTIREILKNVGKGTGHGYEWAIEKIKKKTGKEYTRRQLLYYKKKFIDPEELLPTKEVKKNLKKRKELIDIVKERARLFKLQKKRIDMEIKTEKKIGKLMSTTNREIQLLNEIMNKLKEDYFELNIMQKAVDRIDVGVDLQNVGLKALIEMFNKDSEKNKD